MKKSCDGCRAYNSSGVGRVCELGYMTKDNYPKSFLHVPQENCPKPRTIQQLFDCKNKARSES